MNKLFHVNLIGLALLCQPVVAQHGNAPLDEDPVFQTVVSHRIHYPVKPAINAIYGRFYAGFTIDAAGHIQDISVLYPKMGPQVSKIYGFDYEIISGLKHMPPLRTSLAGDYVLPIAFCFTHYGERATPLVPTNRLPVGYDIGSRAMLNEVKIFASSPSSLRGLSGFPASRQLGQ